MAARDWKSQPAKGSAEGSAKGRGKTHAEGHGNADSRPEDRTSDRIKGRAKERAEQRAKGYLDGQFLIAMPSMEDSRFSRALIYMCAHSGDGAMGIIVNQPAEQIAFHDLLAQFDIIPKPAARTTGGPAARMQVHRGGPVQTDRGFVLHSTDYFIENATLPIDENICLTATLEILRAIAAGTGPDRAILALGYAGWAPGQLESEIQANGWLHCPATPELIFDTGLDTKYDRALAMMGIRPELLSTQAGHA